MSRLSIINGGISSRTNVKKLNTEQEREIAIGRAMKQITKSFGTNSILSLQDKAEQTVMPLSSGILSLNQAMGVGGYPKGRIVEIFGAESSGKTTVALHAVAQTQKNGGFVAYIDVENALDPTYAENIGVDLEKLYLSQPSSAEEAFFTVESFVSTGAFDLIIIDSVASLTPQKEIDGICVVGEQARMMSEQLRKLVAIINKSKCVVIFINQIRSTMNEIGKNQETTPGGKALKFYSSIRIEIKPQTLIKNSSGKTIGKKTHLIVQKNKVAAPFKQVIVANIFGQGFTPYLDIIKVGIETGFIKKMQNWYSFDDQKIGQGVFEVKEYLENHPLVYSKLLKFIEKSD